MRHRRVVECVIERVTRNRGSRIVAQIYVEYDILLPQPLRFPYTDNARDHQALESNVHRSGCIVAHQETETIAQAPACQPTTQLLSRVGHCPAAAEPGVAL